MRYACIASTKGGARCRNFVENPGELCSFHQQLEEEGREIRPAPKPDTILVKFNLNLDRSQRLEMAGVSRKVTSWVEKEEKHINHAKEFSRDPYRYREVADSGVPIFGTQGVTDASLFSAWKELLGEGYFIHNIHLKSRRDRKMDVLIITLDKTKGMTLSPRLLQELQLLLSSSWGFVHIWANPPEKGKVVHTINLGHREPQKSPQWNLCFNHGLWALTP